MVSLIFVLTIALLAPTVTTAAGRETVIYGIPDTQHVNPAAESVADDARAWVWARVRDQRLGLARDDSTASGGHAAIAILSYGDHVEAPENTTQWDVWEPFYLDFDDSGPYGDGPLPWLTVIGNHDFAGTNPPNADESTYLSYFPAAAHTYPEFVECNPDALVGDNRWLYDGVHLNCLMEMSLDYGWPFRIMGLDYYGFQALDWAQTHFDARDEIPTVMVSHRAVGASDDSPFTCVWSNGEYYNDSDRFAYFNEEILAWLSGHDRCLDNADPGVVRDERCGCEIEELTEHGHRLVAHMRNYQDLNFPTPTSDGDDTIIVDVVTIDWDENTIRFQVYDPQADEFVSGDERLTTGMDFERFMPPAVGLSGGGSMGAM